MRIAYVIDHLSRHGTQLMLVNLVTGLAEQGYRQRVYCLNDPADADILRVLTASGVPVLVIGKAQLVTLVGVVRLFVDFRCWRPLIVQTFLTMGDAIGRTLARLTNVPIVVSSIRARNVQKRWWHFVLDRMTVRWVDKVVFNSKQVIPFAQANEGVRPEQVVYIPNGVRIGQQDRTPDAMSLIHKELHIVPNTKVIGTVGRLVPQKGHRFLLAAFSDVLSDVPDTVLLIVGDGTMRANLEAQARRLRLAGKVRFLGERADVPDLLSCMDVYVHASLWEGMPNAVMEAMAAGKPIVATGVDGTRELITDGETGWLVEPSDSKAMAQRVVYALKNVTEARRVGRAALQSMAKDYSVDRMVLAYDRLYRGLIAERRPV